MRTSFIILAKLPARTTAWLSQDRKLEEYYHLSPYSYCAANPIRYVDPSGEWFINVSASPDREKNPYAVMSVFNKDEVLIFRTVVKVKGKFRDRSSVKADTPQGVSKILEWRKTGNSRYPAKSFGKNDLLALEYQEGEGKGRQNMHIHGGRSQEINLTDTYGCIRIKDEDIASLKQVTDKLTEENPDDLPETVTVRNDLQEHVRYADREKYLIQGSILLSEIIVFYNKEL